MQAGQTDVHDHVDDAGQGDGLVHRQEHGQEGKGHHGAADAADAGNETACDPGEEHTDLSHPGHTPFLRPRAAPSVHEKSNYLSGHSASGQTTAGRQRTARRSPHAAIAVPPGVSRTAFPRPSGKRPVPPGPAPHAASRSTGSGTSRATAFRTTRHRSPQSRSCLRAPSGPRPLPCRPARMRNRPPRSPCLGRSRPFGNRKKEKRHKKREPVQNGQAPAYSP